VTTSRKTPTRTCIGCGEAKDKRELVRLVRTPSGDVEVDPSGKANGRGAYLCDRPECFENAATRGRISAALKTSVRDDDVDRLMREFAEILSARNS
jgi:predicted RNA-binding protein YlxR (DUF448 family)